MSSARVSHLQRGKSPPMFILSRKLEMVTLSFAQWRWSSFVSGGIDWKFATSILGTVCFVRMSWLINRSVSVNIYIYIYTKPFIQLFTTNNSQDFIYLVFLLFVSWSEG